MVVKKNVLLVVLPYLMKCDNSVRTKLRSFKAFPYGVLSMASYLRAKAGDKINVQVLDCNLDDDRDLNSIIKERIIEFKPDIIGLSMMFDNSYGYVKDFASIIREHNNNAIVVMGGPAATSSYATIMNEQSNIDAICFYEGEIPFLKMVNSENIIEYLESDVSWITKKSLKEGRVPQKSLLQSLDDVIDIDYSFVDVSSYAMKEAFSPFADKIGDRRQFFLVTSRGCSYNCVFCIHSADNDKIIRYANIDKVIAHVKYLISKYKMNVLTIYDDQILLNKERAKQLFRKLAQFNLRIECPNGLSVAFMDEEMIRLMRNAGMDTVNLAIESGSPYVLNKIINKPLRLEMVKPVVQNLRKYNFWIHGFFVSGLPGERDEHRDETVKFIKEVGLDWSGFSVAIPTRGSRLFKICMENGYINKDVGIGDVDSSKITINTPEYSSDYIKDKTYLMNLDVNFVNNFRMKNGDYGIAVDAFRDVLNRYENHAFAYYYLSKALKAMNRNVEARRAMDKYREIVWNDATWKKYAEYFKIF